MASSACCFPDIYDWIQNLPSITQWKTNSISISICSTSSYQSSLNLSVTKNNLQSPTLISFSLTADYSLPISLWASKPFKTNTKSTKLLEEDNISNLLTNFIEDVLKYGSNKNRCNPLLKFPKLDSISNFKDIFNLAFLTLSLLICIYEAPANLRAGCLNTLKNQLTGCQSRAASKLLMQHLGSNLEEQWIRSINLAITNWIAELQATRRTIKTPSPLFSYAISTYGLWKIHLYCPVIAMDIENSSNPSADERLLFSLNYHQLEGVIQFNYRVMIQEKWVNFMLSTDNIRCDVIRLVNETLMNERGVGIDEKHFPSRISLQLTPTLQTNIFSVSVSKSSENPTREIEVEKTIEGSFDPPNSFLGLKVSAGETMTMSMKPWKFEQSVYGYSTILNWFLHDSMDGREVFSSKPSKISLLNPKAWFKDRYSSAYRPFTRQGGVIFAGDEYGEKVWWKLDRAAVGKTMEWEIRGWIWLTYWPNKHRTFHNETRRLEFREILHLNIA
ncbi:Neuronal PAS domain protein [Melia azedarach]|uniref:Neuronal PAS domain protein n=1 Tax=Melia azedarach TaxID=155640 RepID=A0ACC1Y8V8_MELAZ|nr:Neuronal PAS domain protein [Melia azedarach]